MRFFKKRNTNTDSPKIIRKDIKYNPDFKSNLDLTQKEIHQFLKPLGFKKRGRTFNRQTEPGVFQVINLQSGQFPIGINYEIPGVKESFYGRFTVNLGVCVEDLYLIKFPPKATQFYQEYECQIRDRLERLINGTDNWWVIDNNPQEIANEINTGLEVKGLDWLSHFDSREKIILNWGDYNNDNSSRAKLDVALIVLQTDKEKGAQLMRDYYNSIESNRKPHRNYVIELAKRFNIQLNK